MGARPTPPQPPSVADLLSAVTVALSPWLPDKAPPPRATPRELRQAAATLSRLRTALALAAASDAALFDRVAAADACLALSDLRDIAARARAASAARPRIPAPAPPPVLRSNADRDRADAPPFPPDDRRRVEAVANRLDGLVQVALWKRRDAFAAAAAAANNPDVYESDDNLSSSAAHSHLNDHHHNNSSNNPSLTSTSAYSNRSPSPRNGPRRARVVPRKGPAWRGRLGRRGRVLSAGDMPVSPLLAAAAAGRAAAAAVTSGANPSLSSSHHPHSALPAAQRDDQHSAAWVTTTGPSLVRQHSSHRAHTPRLIAPPPPWAFSPIESPITPLRTRTLAPPDDGSAVLAMWRGRRVSVRMSRYDRAAFVRDADFLFALGQSPNVPTLLGAHWEAAPKPKQKKGAPPINDSDIGYLVLEVVNGVSLDKLVRDGNISDTVTMVRILERVVSTLVFAQKILPNAAHQDLHPGNILLVPTGEEQSHDLDRSDFYSSDRPPVRHDPAAIILADPTTPTVTASDAATTATATTTTATSPTITTPTDAQPAAVSQSSLPNAASTADGTPFVLGQPPEPVASPVVDHAFSTSHRSQPSPTPPTPPPTQILQHKGPSASAPALPDIPTEPLQGTGREPSPPSLLLSTHNDNIHIPKVEELSEALTVLERVALHDSIDIAARHEAITQSQSSSRPTALPLPEPTTPASSGAAGEMIATSPPVPPTTPDDGMRSEATPRSASFCLSASTAARSAAYSVMVMDFPSAAEAEGLRVNASWHANDALAGYCPPERATPAMWRVVQHRREKERERRMLAARSSSSGRSSPRPSSQRRSGGSGDTGGHATITSNRSGSSSQRRAFDSETYALFGDDHLVDIPEPDIDSSRADVEARARRSGRLVLEDDSRGDQKGTSRGSDGSGDRTGSSSSDSERAGKVDVWGLGWLVYYMATGRHAPRDAWARRCGISERELRDVPSELRDIVRVCAEPDAGRRACLREVKRRVDSLLQRLMFGRGVALLDGDTATAFMLLDKAVGLRRNEEGSGANLANGLATGLGTPGTSGTTATMTSATSAGVEGSGLDDAWLGVAKETKGKGNVVGGNAKTRAALAALPVVVVRRVEWEAAARFLGRPESELIRLRRALVRDKWNKTDVRDGAGAVRYLTRHADEGVIAAQSALGWVLRWGAGGVGKDVQRAMRLWECAASCRDPEACNGLGLLLHHGRGDEVAVDGRRAKELYERAVAEGYPAAAVNLGVMLHDGADGVEADGVAARGLYEMAVRAGDAVAANNLGLLLQHGGVGVIVDARGAVAAYEVAIRRGERHHACRNLGELLWDGGEGVRQDRVAAVSYLEMAIRRGDATSRGGAIARVRRLLDAADEVDEHLNIEVERRCHALLRDDGRQ